MEGTRVSLLKDLEQWSMDVTSPPVFWLDGMAGTGKSAIARSFCRSLRDSHRLGGSFFCRRGNESRANVKRILPTLAWFLARQHSQYKSILFEILREAPDVADYTIKCQVEFLLEKPLRRVFVDRRLPPLVLAIDALDECADAEEVEQLLNKLLFVSKDLPVKFFLTSRPERHIVSHFESSQPEFSAYTVSSRTLFKKISRFTSKHDWRISDVLVTLIQSFPPFGHLLKTLRF